MLRMEPISLTALSSVAGRRRLTGHDDADQLGRTVEEVIPDLAPIVGPDFRQVLHSGEPLLNREITG